MPRAGWVKPESDRRLSDLVSVGVLTRVFPPALVDEAIAGAGRTEQRHRALPARVMAYFAVGMGLHSEGSYLDVLSLLTDGLSWQSGWSQSWKLPSKSADLPGSRSAWCRTSRGAVQAGGDAARECRGAGRLVGEPTVGGNRWDHSRCCRQCRERVMVRAAGGQQR